MTPTIRANRTPSPRLPRRYGDDPAETLQFDIAGEAAPQVRG